MADYVDMNQLQGYGPNPYTQSPPGFSTSTLDQINQYAGTVLPEQMTPNFPAPTPTPVEPVVPTKVSGSVSHGTKDSVGVSSDVSGVNEEKAKRLGKESPVDARTGARMAAYNEAMAPGIAAQQTATDQQRKGVADQYAIDAEKADVTAKETAEYNKVAQDHDNAIAEAMAKRDSNLQAAQANWEQTKAKAMSMSINPGQLWQNLSGGEKVGSLMSVFINGFLGAKGIDTGIMATLDKAIDRNIAAQRDNMDQANRAVGFAQDAYDMVAKTSASELETKYKLKDLAFESFRRDLASKLAPYDSKLAQAKWVEADALLQKAQAENQMAIVKDQQNTYNSIFEQEANKYRDELNAANERIRASADMTRARTDARRQAAEADAADNDAFDKIVSRVNQMAIVDPSSGGTRFLMFEGPMSDDKAYEKRIALQERASSVTGLNNLLEEFSGLAQSLGPTYQGPWGKDLNVSQKKARLYAIGNQLAMKATKEMSGLTATDQFTKNITRMLPVDGWSDDLFNTEKAVALAGNFQQIINDDFFSSVKGHTREPSKEESMLLRPRVGGDRSFVGTGAGENTPGGFLGENTTSANKKVIGTKAEPLSDSEQLYSLLDTSKAGMVDTPSGKIFELNVETNTKDKDAVKFFNQYQADNPKEVKSLYSKDELQARGVSLPTYAIFKLGLNARAGDARAEELLNNVANEVTGLKGENKGTSKQAKFAQYVLSDLVYGKTKKEGIDLEEVDATIKKSLPHTYGEVKIPAPPATTGVVGVPGASDMIRRFSPQDATDQYLNEQYGNK